MTTETKKEHTPGQWNSEPDSHVWNHMGLRCAIRRHQDCGHLCGYVGVSSGHPWYGKGYNDKVPWQNMENHKIDIDKMGTISCFCASIHADFDNKLLAIVLILKAHGGITYANSKADYPTKHNKLWWFGFDCNHAGDYAPGSSSSGTYRDFDYVKNETEHLAEQLAAIAKATLS